MTVARGYSPGEENETARRMFGISKDLAMTGPSPPFRRRFVRQHITDPSGSRVVRTTLGDATGGRKTCRGNPCGCHRFQPASEGRDGNRATTRAAPADNGGGVQRVRRRLAGIAPRATVRMPARRRRTRQSPTPPQKDCRAHRSGRPRFGVERCASGFSPVSRTRSPGAAGGPPPTTAAPASPQRRRRAAAVERYGPVRSVMPGLVFEVAFDAVARSTRRKSGLAMRFPRIRRIRWDKPPERADRVETLRAMTA